MPIGAFFFFFRIQDNSPRGQMTILAHAYMRVVSIIFRNLITIIFLGDISLAGMKLDFMWFSRFHLRFPCFRMRFSCFHLCFPCFHLHGFLVFNCGFLVFNCGFLVFNCQSGSDVLVFTYGFLLADGLENGSPEDWCVVDEWSEHSESELEEGEIVDSDSARDTKRAVSLDNVLAFVADTRRSVSHSDVHSGDTKWTVSHSDVHSEAADYTRRTVSHSDTGSVIHCDTRRTVSHSDVLTVTAGTERTVGHSGKRRTASHRGKKRRVTHSGKKRTVRRHRKVRKEIYDTATGIWLKMADVSGSEDGEIVDPENALNRRLVGEANTGLNSIGNADENSFPSSAVGMKASSDFHVGSRQKPVLDDVFGVKASSDFHVGIRQKPVLGGAIGLKASSGFHVGIGQKQVLGGAVGVKASSDLRVGSKQKLLKINRQKAASYQSGKLVARPDSIVGAGGSSKQRGGGTGILTNSFAEGISTASLQESEVIEDSDVQNTASTKYATAHDEDLTTPCSSPNIGQESDHCNSSFDALDPEFATSMKGAYEKLTSSDNDNVTVGSSDGTVERIFFGSTACVFQHGAAIGQDSQSIDPDEEHVPADVTSSDLSIVSSAGETSANVMTPSSNVASARESSSDVATPSETASSVILAAETSRMSLSVTSDKCKVSKESGPFGNAAAAFGAECEMVSMSTDQHNGENMVMESLGSYGVTPSSEANADFTDYLATDGGFVGNDTGLIAENTSLTDMNDELITAIAELVREDEELAAKNRETDDLEEGFLYKEPAFETTSDSEPNGDADMASPAESVYQDEVLVAKANETVISPAVFLDKDQDIEINPDSEPNNDLNIVIPATVSSAAIGELVDEGKVPTAKNKEQPMVTDNDQNRDTDIVIPATVSSGGDIADLFDQDDVSAAEAKETVGSEVRPAFESNELNIDAARPATVSPPASADLVDRDELLPADVEDTPSPQAVLPDKEQVTETNSDNDPNVVDRAAVVSSAETTLSTMSVSTSLPDADAPSVMSSVDSSPCKVDVISLSAIAGVAAPSEMEVSSADIAEDTAQSNGNNSGGPDLVSDQGTNPCGAVGDSGEGANDDDAVASIHPATGCVVQGAMPLGSTGETAAVTIEQDVGTVIDVDADNRLIAPSEDQSRVTDSKKELSLLRNNAVSAMLSQLKGRPVSAGPELMRRLTDSDSETAGIAKKVSHEHQCDFCQAQFKDESQLVLHINTHEVIQPALKVASTFVYSHQLYQCVACHFSTRSRQVFREHTRSHIVKYPYWCGVCQTAVMSFDSLLRHSGTTHPHATLKIVPRCSLTLEQILHKIGPAAPSTMTKLQKADGTPMCCVMRSNGSQPAFESPHEVALKQNAENKDPHPDTEQVIMVDDVDEEAESQTGDSADSTCHLKIASVVSLCHSASAIEDFSKRDDNVKENSVVMPEMYETPTKLNKSNVIIECFFKDALYQCRRCRFKTHDQRVFHCHVVQEVHEKPGICLDCRDIPMATLLSETHSCPVVEKVMLAMRKQLQESGGGRPESTASAAGSSCSDQALVARSAPEVPEEGYTLHITEADDYLQPSGLGRDTTTSGLKFQTTVSAPHSSTQASPAAIPPVVPKTTQVYFMKPHRGASIASGSPTVPSSTAVRVTPSSPHGTHHVIRVNRPTDTPTPIVIQPIDPDHLDRMTTASSETVSLATMPIYGMADSATPLQSGATTGQSKAPATESVETRMTTIRTSSGGSQSMEEGHGGSQNMEEGHGGSQNMEEGHGGSQNMEEGHGGSQNMEEGHGGSWSNQLPVAPFSDGASPSGGAKCSMDSSFTEALSMLEELGNAQAGLSAQPHPQLNGSTSDVNIRSMLASPSTQTVPPLLDVTDQASGSASDTASRFVDDVPPLPRRTDVVSSTARSSSCSPSTQQGRSTMPSSSHKWFLHCCMHVEGNGVRSTVFH